MAHLELTCDTHQVRTFKQTAERTLGGSLERIHSNPPYYAQSIRVVKSASAPLRFVKHGGSASGAGGSAATGADFLTIPLHFAHLENIQQIPKRPMSYYASYNSLWYDVQELNESTGKWQRRWQHRAFYISVADIFRLFCCQHNQQRQRRGDDDSEARPELAEVLPLVEKVARRITNDAESPLVAPGSKANHITHDNILGFITGGGKGFTLGSFERSKEGRKAPNGSSSQSGLEVFCTNRLLELPSNLTQKVMSQLLHEKRSGVSDETLTRAMRSILEDFTTKMAPSLVVQIMRYYLFGEDPSVRQRSKMMFVFEEPVSVPEALEHAMQSEHLEVRQVEKMKFLLGKITKPLSKKHAAAALAIEEQRYILPRGIDGGYKRPIPSYLLRHYYVRRFNAINDTEDIEECLRRDMDRKHGSRQFASTRLWDINGASSEEAVAGRIPDVKLFSLTCHTSCRCERCIPLPGPMKRDDDICFAVGASARWLEHDLEEDLKNEWSPIGGGTVEDERYEYEEWLAAGEADDSNEEDDNDDLPAQVETSAAASRLHFALLGALRNRGNNKKRKSATSRSFSSTASSFTDAASSFDVVSRNPSSSSSSSSGGSSNSPDGSSSEKSSDEWIEL